MNRVDAMLKMGFHLLFFFFLIYSLDAAAEISVLARARFPTNVRRHRTEAKSPVNNPHSFCVCQVLPGASSPPHLSVYVCFSCSAPKNRVNLSGSSFLSYRGRSRMICWLCRTRFLASSAYSQIEPTVFLHPSTRP